MSAILIHDTLHTTSPFNDALKNEALWWCAPVCHSSAIVSWFNNGVELPAVVDLLLQAPQVA